MKRVFVLALVSLGAALCVPAQRLPDTVVPETYDLTFAPDLAKATFSGEETVHVRIQKPLTAITLNSAELEFEAATITSGGATETAQVTFDESKEQATLTVPKELPAGPAEIGIRFTGVLNDKLRGFYLSKSDRRNYAVTQFEATDARRAFPSFDEPAFKAVFHITLVVDQGDTAISNGKITSDTPGPGDRKHTLKFSPSPKMSSYLVVMLVGDFACREGGADGIPIRVCSLPEKKEMTAYALEASENILKFYDRYYSMKHPYGKLDHIVFPDFSAGAMENVAAITYRDADLLLDERTASYDAKQQVASVIAHEMAHQWFGDLVTMNWWNDIWLNEGFATWMSWKPLESWKPEWHMDQQEIAETLGSLDVDAIPSVRTIRANAETPADIQALFDGIAYGKAAAVLRMVEAYVGPETFQKGVNAYLEKHQYGNATAEDFWNQITETSGKPVDKIMTAFTEQPGAPLVSTKASCQGGKTEVTLSEERYFSDASRMASGSRESWPIPVNLLPSSTKKSVFHLLTRKQETFDLPGCSEWVFANAGGRGYYHSSYEPESFAKMASAVETSLSADERIRVPSDAWALVRIGRMNIGSYLNLLESMQGERSRAVLQAMTRPIPQIHDQFVSAADRPAFEKWVSDFLAPIARDLGETPVPGEPPERQALRGDIFALLAQYGRDPELIAKVRTVTEQYMKDAQSVSADLAGKALATSAMNGDAELYDQYLAHLKTAKTPEEYGIYLEALGFFPEPALAKRTFDLVLGPQVKNQDLFALYIPLVNYKTQTAAWQLFKADYPEVMKKIDASDAVALAQLAGVFCDASLRDDSQKFFAEKNLPGSERILQNAKDQVNACIQVRDLQQSNLSTFLRR